ncbi:MAG: hypothetical protein K9W42_04985 [Candidatus Heimdallarchaeota archaeon]|nr:hypothetical protein [Candidatus Heimdallarchaeota archaeon]
MISVGIKRSKNTRELVFKQEEVKIEKALKGKRKMGGGKMIAEGKHLTTAGYELFFARKKSA